MMSDSHYTRRNFGQLAAAAVGGLMLGAGVGCAANVRDDKDDKDDKDEKNPLLTEPHVCRGLNTCKSVGATKDNACAGMGQCATAKAHECAGMNECKGQGGCGAKPGENACKGKGECAVPLSEKKWKVARKSFEEAMKKAGKKFGEAPKPKKS
jgi:hypothetical protein